MAERRRQLAPRLRPPIAHVSDRVRLIKELQTHMAKFCRVRPLCSLGLYDTCRLVTGGQGRG